MRDNYQLRITNDELPITNYVFNCHSRPHFREGDDLSGERRGLRRNSSLVIRH